MKSKKVKKRWAPTNEHNEQAKNRTNVQSGMSVCPFRWTLTRTQSVDHASKALWMSPYKFDYYQTYYSSTRTSKTGGTKSYRSGTRCATPQLRPVVGACLEARRRRPVKSARTNSHRKHFPPVLRCPTARTGARLDPRLAGRCPDAI